MENLFKEFCFSYERNGTGAGKQSGNKRGSFGGLFVLCFRMRKITVCLCADGIMLQRGGKKDARKRRDNCWSNDLEWEIGAGMLARCTESCFIKPGEKLELRNIYTSRQVDIVVEDSNLLCFNFLSQVVTHLGYCASERTRKM